MPVPTRIDYDEAISPAFLKYRLKVADPELKEGQVEMVRHQTSAGMLESPWGMEGGFAIVYKFRRRSGALRALRVFKRDMEPDTQRRYELMGDYFKAHVSDITADVQYHPVGIALKIGQSSKPKTFPLIEMEWVDGLTLVDKLDELCRKRDKASIERLAGEWIGLLRKMRQAGMAHGDLAGLNVMVRPNGRLVLIDYDGVYIPAFAGMNAVVAGQPDYQHPKMQERPFDAWMDEFSGLVIHTALLALRARPELWDRFTVRGDKNKLKNDNLLFAAEDFLNPAQSRVFKELGQLRDTELKAALDALKNACQQLPYEVRLPVTLIDPDHDKKEALAMLAAAIKSDDDTRIWDVWNPVLSGYAPAKPHLTRVELARKRLDALSKLQQALASDDDDAITQAYNPILDKYPAITSAQRQRIDLARKRGEALQRLLKVLNARGDEREIVKAYDPILDNSSRLLSIQRKQIELAQRCVQMPDAVRAAIRTDNDDQIVAAYDISLVRPWMTFSPAETSRLNLAPQRIAALDNFRQGLKTEDDDRIVAAYSPILDNYKKIQSAEWKRLELARRRVAALNTVRIALYGSDERQIVAAYDHVLDGYSKLLAVEVERIKLAHRCVHMPDAVRAGITADDDEKIAAAYDIQLVRPWTGFTTQEDLRIALAGERKAALAAFRNALASDDDDQIVTTYRPVLDNYSQVGIKQRHRLELARNRRVALQRMRQALADGDEWTIAAADNPLLAKYHKILPAEWEQIALALRVVRMPEAVRRGIQANDDAAIVAAYDPVLIRGRTGFTQLEQDRIALASERVTALVAFRMALDVDDDDQIVATYSAILEGYPAVQPAEQQRLELARTRLTALQNVRKALFTGDERQIVTAYHSVLDNYPKLLDIERQQIERARACVQMPGEVRAAIQADDDKGITHAYDPGLVRPFTAFTAVEQQRIELAIKRWSAFERFQAAIYSGDDDQIVAAYEPILKSYPRIQSLWLQRLELAHRRKAALQRFWGGLVSNDEQQIVASYDPILDNYPKVREHERERLDIARRRLVALPRFWQAIQSDADAQILTAYDDALNGYAEVTLEQRQRLALARRRIAALDAFCSAVAAQDERRIVNDYDAVLDGYPGVKPEARAMLEQARRVVSMPERVRAALQADDDERINGEFEEGLVRQWTGLTLVEMQRVRVARERVRVRREVEQALDNDNVERAIQIERSAKLPLALPRLDRAKADFLARMEPQNLTALLQGEELVMQWQWPSSGLVGVVAVVWRVDRTPITPGEVGAKTELVNRALYTSAGEFRCKVGKVPQAHVRVFSALDLRQPGPQGERWLYSPGQDIGASVLARRPTTVRWHLKQKRGSAKNQLEVRTVDNSPLPELLLVRKIGGLPMSHLDGVKVAHIESTNGGAGRSHIIPLDVKSWPRGTILRLFTAKAEDLDRVIITGDSGVKIEVN